MSVSLLTDESCQRHDNHVREEDTMSVQNDYSSLLTYKVRSAELRRAANQARLANDARRRRRRRRTSARPWWRRLTGTGQLRPASTT